MGALALAAAILLVAATGSGSESPRPVVIAVGGEPGTLNWLVTTGGTNTERAWVRPLFDPLAERDGDGRLQPVLLERVPTIGGGGMRRTAGGGLVVALELRPDATWSDGTPLTCADVAFTWRTIVSDRWPTSPRGGWDRVTAVECPSRHRALVRFSEDSSVVELVLTAFPLPAHHLAGRDFRTAMRDDAEVHSGPYRLARWKRGVGLAYERDPDYWRREAPAGPRQLELRATSGGGSADLLVATDRVDVAIRPLSGTLEDERQAFGDRLQLLPPRTVVALAFNHGRPATGDIALRRAVLAAIDRTQVARAALGRDGKAAPSLIAGAATANDPWGQATGTDASAATAPARPLVLVAPAGRAPLERAALVLHSQLADAGIPVVLRAQAPELYFGQTMPKGRWDLMLVEMVASPEEGIRPAIACEPAAGRTNFMRFCDEAVDAIQERRDAELDAGLRSRLDEPLERALATRVAAIPLFQPRTAWIGSGRLRGMRPSSDGHLVGGFEHWQVAE